MADIPAPPPVPPKDSEENKPQSEDVKWRPRTEWSVLPANQSGGPMGLGDPNDLSLRKVEEAVTIPMVMRDRAWMEKCRPEVLAYEKCAKQEEIMMVVRCRQQNNVMQTCVKAWFRDEQFQKECRKIYLDKRSHYRRTGEGQKLRREEMKWQ